MFGKFLAFTHSSTGTKSYAFMILILPEYSTLSLYFLPFLGDCTHVPDFFLNGQFQYLDSFQDPYLTCIYIFKS